MGVLAAQVFFTCDENPYFNVGFPNVCLICFLMTGYVNQFQGF